jgi:predicted TIM-barrel fold metal-dependent hydrolase
MHIYDPRFPVTRVGRAASRPARAISSSTASGASPRPSTAARRLREWAPNEGTRKRILVDNPAKLYGFAAIP